MLIEELSNFGLPTSIPANVGAGVSRPFWSVMIPAYRPAERYLLQTIESVLAQGVAPDEMQIEVVDDNSPECNVEEMIQRIAGGCVSISRTPRNMGLAGCWNACISRSRGEWVHILHQDDVVLPGFYRKIRELAEKHPSVALIATRSFIIDEEGIINGVTQRIPELEVPGNDVSAFFYITPVQCPGVVVKRTFYEAHGGFQSDLVYTLDREMWARTIATSGGVVAPDVLSCYRFCGGTETGRLAKSAENLRDFQRLNEIFSQRYPKFDRIKARNTLAELAMFQYKKFNDAGDLNAARLSMEFWENQAPARLRIRRLVGGIVRTLLP